MCIVKAGGYDCEKHLDEAGRGEGRLHQARVVGRIYCRKNVWELQTFEVRLDQAEQPGRKGDEGHDLREKDQLPGLGLIQTEHGDVDDVAR